MTSKTRNIAYWSTLGLFSLAMVGSGFADLAHGDEMTKGFAKLGYPAYLMTVLGVAKLLGAAAITAPRTARLKEWAYAGFTFDLLGAAISHVASGDEVSHVVTPPIILAIGMASWWLRPADRKLAAPVAPATQSSPSLSPAHATT